VVVYHLGYFLIKVLGVFSHQSGVFFPLM